MEVWHELSQVAATIYSAVVIDGHNRVLQWKKQLFSGCNGKKTVNFIGVKSAVFPDPPIIGRELICIYSNLVHSVTHQLPPGVWQEQAQSLTSFLYLAVTDKACVWSGIKEVFLWGFECLNDGSNKGFYRLPYGRSFKGMP